MKIGLLPITAKPVVSEGDSVCAPNVLVFHLAREFEKTGHQVKVFAGADSDSSLDICSINRRSPFSQYFKGQDIMTDPYYIKIVNEYNISLTEKAIELANRSNIDVISSHDIRYNIGHAARSDVNFVYTIHGDMASDRERLDPYLKIAKNAKNIFFTAMSKGNLKFCEDYGLNVLGLTPNGVDTEKFGFNGESRSGVLFVGRITESKGIREAIEASLLTGNKITIIGPKGISNEDINYFNELEETFFSNPNVEYLGYKKPSDLVPFYKSSKVMITVSKKEGMSLAILEALSTGLPVIASNIEGTKDVIDDGFNGFLIDSQDSNIISQKLSMIGSIKNEDCRQTIVDNFSIQKMAESYLSCFDKLRK